MGERSLMGFQIKKIDDTEKLEDITIKIVGFRVGVDKAVYYKRLSLPNDREFGKYMNIAFQGKNCDFVSVRRV